MFGPVLSYKFILDNKRLDEWVDEDRLDLRKVQYPRKDGKDGCATPKRIGGQFTGSGAGKFIKSKSRFFFQHKGLLGYGITKNAIGFHADRFDLSSGKQ